MADNITVKDSTGASRTMRTTDNSGVHTAHQIISIDGTALGAAKPMPISDNGGSITIDGTVAISSISPGTSGTNLGSAVDAVAGATDVGVASLAVRRDTLSTLTPISGDYSYLYLNSQGRLWTSATIDAALPAGTNAIGKLAANSGVDIGDVDVISITPGTGATNLGKAVDAASAATDTGVASLAIRTDTLATLTPIVGDYTQLRVNSVGRLWTSATIDAALPAGTNAIGKLAANSGVDIGDVDVISVTPGTGATNLGKLVNGVAGASDVGVAMLGIRDDTLTTLSPADGDYGRFRMDAIGRMWTNSHVNNAYDSVDDMFKVKSVQKKFRDSFPGTSLDATKWDSTIGSGGSIAVSSGVVTIGSGTTANAETSILSKERFTVPFRISTSFTLSQRIANQTFILEAVSVDPSTGVPDGLHTAALVFDGTSATAGKYRVQNSGLTPLDSAASTLPTTASGSTYEIEPFADECWFHGGVLDSNAGRANSYRRHQQIPDPNAVYKIRLRWVNGATAPASNTNAVVQFVACQDYAELTAEITAGRGQSVAGQGVGVNVITMPSITATLASSSTSYGYSTVGKRISTADTNAAAIKTSVANVGWINVHNLSASTRYVKVYNKASAPTVGTDVPVQVIPVRANSEVMFVTPTTGLRLTTGFALAITGGIADTDTTAIGANEVIVNWGYI